MQNQDTQYQGQNPEYIKPPLLPALSVKSFSLFNRLLKWRYGAPAKAPVFAIQNPVLQEQNPAAFLQQRLYAFAEQLGMNTAQSELKEWGDRYRLEFKNRVAQVYKRSDAMWYFDRELVAPSDPQFAQELPAQADAVKKANLSLQLLDLKKAGGDPFARLLGVDHTVVSKNRGPNVASEVFRTEVRVHYGFSLAGRRVFGPGGKMQCGFVKGDTEMSELIYFWRKPVIDGDGAPLVTSEKPLISPRRALWKLAWRKYFFRMILLKCARLRITTLELGYYAAPPYVLQTHFVPVYRIKGTIKVRGELVRHFSYFVSAARLSAAARLSYGWPFTSGTIMV